jgi:hypothetical protein
MANIVVKPADAVGNALILKDESGGAVLTTADSGSTLANTTLTNQTTFTTDLTIASDANAVVVGPVTIPNVTVNGNLNAIQALDVTGTINIDTGGSLNILG